MGEHGGPDVLLSRCCQRRSKSSPSASSGSLGLSLQLPAGAGSYDHLCPSLRTWTSPGCAFLGTKCKGNTVFPKQDHLGSQ